MNGSFDEKYDLLMDEWRTLQAIGEHPNIGTRAAAGAPSRIESQHLAHLSCLLPIFVMQCAL